jgi:hypothetical protein
MQGDAEGWNLRSDEQALPTVAVKMNNRNY